MSGQDIDGAVALQKACFPDPFPEELLWSRCHLQRHLEIFPEGQFAAVESGFVVGTASSLLIESERWSGPHSWKRLAGDHFFSGHNPSGDLLYGADISVHPNHRGKGIAKALYSARFRLVEELGLAGFVTCCRIPDWLEWSNLTGILDKTEYCLRVIKGEIVDRTLSPLLRIGLKFAKVSENYMDDVESGNAAASLEWMP